VNDTNPAIERKMRELMARKSPQERLRMGCSMFMFAKALVKASIDPNGVTPEPVLRQKLFLRFYGDEFEESEKNKILEHLGSIP